MKISSAPVGLQIRNTCGKPIFQHARIFSSDCPCDSPNRKNYKPVMKVLALVFPVVVFCGNGLQILPPVRAARSGFGVFLPSRNRLG
jgi:hypothetical protein